MPSYHAEPNRSAPATHTWFSVETPSVFREYKLPASEADWTAFDHRKFGELEELAKRHATHIHRSEYRRG
jgi:hypothetical protein